MAPRGAELKARFLELLRTDEEFRYAVAGLLGLEEVLKAIRDLQKQVAYLREDFKALSIQVAKNTEAIRSLQEQVAENAAAIRSLQEQVRSLQEQVISLQEQVRSLQEQVAENTKAIRELREDMNRLREDMNEGFKLLRRHIDALGARWGILAEEAFREGMVGVVERYFGGKVERWAYYDEDGFVFGFPTVVEVDFVIRDGEHILIEIKSSVSRADVFELWRIGKLYEKVRGVRPRLAIVSPFVREDAKRMAKEFGIDVYTSLPP